MTAKRLNPQTPEGGVPLVDSPTYFQDPALDSVVAMMMELAAQVWVHRDRMMAVEDLLAKKGTVTRADLDAYEPSDARKAEVRAERDAFVEAVFTRFQDPSASRGDG